MVGGESDGLASARAHLACGRIAGTARAIAEAHRLGAPEGPHDRLWAPEYLAGAVHIYGESLTPDYQRGLAHLYRDSADAMSQCVIPAGLAGEWFVVTSYLNNASDAIMSWLRSRPAQKRQPARTPVIDDRVPGVIHFHRLAALATHRGACRLERAALAVQRQLGAPSAPALDDRQRRLLQRVASGVPIVDLAEELGYSRRSMFRELAKLWSALGVADRVQALRKAAAEGLLD